MDSQADPASPVIASAADRRPRLPEPPPVSLVSVADVRLVTAAGLETRLDDFYLRILGFVRGQDVSRPAYEAENHAVVFDVYERPPPRGDVRAVGVTTLRFADVVSLLEAGKIEYERVRGVGAGVGAGVDGVLVQDPAGNWLAVTPVVEIR